MWARGRCRISPPRFLAECCKRQLNQGSFVLLYFKLSTFSDLYWVCLSVFSCTVLFVSISQVIGCEDRLRNDLYCVEWGVKLYSNPTWSICRIAPLCHRPYFYSQSCYQLVWLFYALADSSWCATVTTIPDHKPQFFTMFVQTICCSQPEINVKQTTSKFENVNDFLRFADRPMH